MNKKTIIITSLVIVGVAALAFTGYKTYQYYREIDKQDKENLRKINFQKQ